MELRATVAALRAKDVAGKALGVDPDQRRRIAADVPLDQRDVVLFVDQGLVDVELNSP